MYKNMNSKNKKLKIKPKIETAEFKFNADNTNINKNSYIFNKYIKNNTNLIPFNVKTLYIGETKYFPPISKE